MKTEIPLQPTCGCCKKVIPADGKMEGYIYSATELSNKWHTNYISYSVDQRAIIVQLCRDCVRKEQNSTFKTLGGIALTGLLIFVLSAVFSWGGYGFAIGAIILLFALYMAVDSWPHEMETCDILAARAVRSKMNRREQENVRLFTRKSKRKLH